MDDEEFSKKKGKCVSNPDPFPRNAKKGKKGKSEETEKTTRVRVGVGVCEDVMTYCFKMT